MTEQQRNSIAAEDRIPWLQLIAYGSGGVIPIALFNIAGQLMGLLGNISLGLSAFWLGAIMIVPRLWDAISDPIMGHLSDNTRTRWGRRKPYLLIGGIAVALSFVAMWWVPRGDAVRDLFASEDAYNWFQLVFILGGLLIFFTACTVFEIPHGALGMEMSGNYHERTRLFSAKSFLGNLFAMGTPWLIYVASLEFFSGPGGDLIDGMRYVSLVIAIVLIPLACWWFLTLSEPRFTAVRKHEKSAFWKDMRTTAGNRVFLRLVAIIFTLAMGFNFVGLFNYYITIFYLYGGDVSAAGPLLGVGGTVWAVTGLVAVFPLNWLSKRWGKNATLLVAIGLMCIAQLSKIVCYNPRHPYLILLPTMLLSAGMLMFFTLGASMVGDICDKDELDTGTRSEGSYYSVYWWFIKMGTAFASFVTGALLVLTSFDEKQNVMVDSLRGRVEVIQTAAESEQTPVANESLAVTIEKQLRLASNSIEELETHFTQRIDQHTAKESYARSNLAKLSSVKQTLNSLTAQQKRLIKEPKKLVEATEQILEKTASLKQQSPTTLFRLRAVEIGLPLLLCVVSIYLTVGYPLTESRCHKTSAELKKRHDAKSESPEI